MNLKFERDVKQEKTNDSDSLPALCFVMPVGVELIRSQSNSMNNLVFSVVRYLRETCRSMMQGLRFLLTAVKPEKKNVLSQWWTNSPRI
jgi:hypothetical protein